MTADLPPALPADMRHLQAFVAAAETGSMSAAAARLHVSQQALAAPWRHSKNGWERGSSSACPVA